jgi:hypothetical protein
MLPHVAQLRIANERRARILEEIADLARHAPKLSFVERAGSVLKAAGGLALGVGGVLGAASSSIVTNVLSQAALQVAPGMMEPRPDVAEHNERMRPLRERLESLDEKIKHATARSKIYDAELQILNNKSEEQICPEFMTSVAVRLAVFVFLAGAFIFFVSRH